MGYVYGKYIVREGYSSDYCIECVCSFMNCSDDMRRVAEEKIKMLKRSDEVQNEDEMESQFSSACPYKVLGLFGSGASDIEIKKQYRELAKKFHPDKNPDRVEWATAVFKNITSAYEVLSDTQRRRAYDNSARGGQTQSYYSFTSKSNGQMNSFQFSFGGGRGASFSFSFNF
eukprot:CAMPEP_0185023486 /NCGR_PEP_ID=MMETSP1103-20130426/6158_1 /TAXON_ID=36769 /ORGANISM="Paraphysomonas bandaiensis, Strain Caron Lab Isolate" /LENGTH=171 /DNA_ID=CAMNT_0027556101 /DNA_START=225 /DNA_END=740 /DNA_ORIENTATION=+